MIVVNKWLIISELNRPIVKDFEILQLMFQTLLLTF